MVEREFLNHLAERNPEVWGGLWRLRQRAYLTAGVPERSRQAIRPRHRAVWAEMRFPGDALLFSVLMAFFVTCAGLAAMKLLWPGLSRGVAGFDVLAIAGAVATWLLARTRDRLSVKPVEPPDADADEPLLELQDLAERSAHRLMQGYRAHLSLAVGVMALLAALIAFASTLVLAGFTRFGVLLGLSALFMASLMGLNWHPFRRAQEVRTLAGEAERAATRLGLTLASCESPDPEDRRHAQWREVARSLVELRRPQEN